MVRLRSALAALAVCVLAVACSSGSDREPAVGQASQTRDAVKVATSPSPGSSADPSGSATASGLAAGASAGRLRVVTTVRGQITPKSVVASGHGLIFAQNMMYTHTVTVYDRSGRLVRTIPDSVRLADFGHAEYTGEHRGAPVEAAFTPDGKQAYVSNYSMYGAGFSGEGHDVCSPKSGTSDSFLYRIDTSTLRIDQAIRVGAVPKYVAITPDRRYVLASNWCSYSLSVVDAGTGREIRQVPLGPYPRGIAVDPSSRTAYVAVMGGTRIARVDLTDFGVSWLPAVGRGPRHLVRDADGRWLYVTLNGEGRVAKVDLRTGRVVGRVATGSQPRSMAISADGRWLYVVNYASSTVSVVRTSDLRVTQTVPVNHHPIGITYDDGTGDVWVACYSGTILKLSVPPG